MIQADAISKDIDAVHADINLASFLKKDHSRMFRWHSVSGKQGPDNA